MKVNMFFVQDACAVCDWGVGLQRSDTEDETSCVHTKARNRGLKTKKRKQIS